MKFVSGIFVRGIAVSAVLLMLGTAAQANNPRNPQVNFNSTSLQNYLNSVGQTINVNTDQFDIPCWSTTVSNNATFTIMLELSGTAAGNSVGVYNCSSVGTPTQFEIFPGAATAGWFAVASFGAAGPGSLVVNLFNGSGVHMGSTTYFGVNAANFGFYLENSLGVGHYTQDARNGGGDPQALVYAGTGTSAGQWWLAFEDSPYATGDQDFDDFVMFMESVNKPVPSLSTTWSGVKLRAR